jgi:hypothetical protein
MLFIKLSGSLEVHKAAKSREFVLTGKVQGTLIDPPDSQAPIHQQLVSLNLLEFRATEFHTVIDSDSQVVAPLTVEMGSFLGFGNLKNAEFSALPS